MAMATPPGCPVSQVPSAPCVSPHSPCCGVALPPVHGCPPQAQGERAGLPGAAVHPPRGEEAGEQPPAGGPLGAAGPLVRPGGTAEPLGLGPCVSPGGGRWVKGWLGAGRGSAHSVQCTHWPAQRPPLSWPPQEPGPHTLPPQIHLCRKKVASRSCHFYNNVEGEGLVGPPSPGVSWEWGGAAGGLAWVSRPDDFAPWAVPLGTLSWVRQVPALSTRWGLCWTAHRWAHRGPGRPPWEGLLARLAPVSGAWLSGGPHRPRQEELPQPELRAAAPFVLSVYLLLGVSSSVPVVQGCPRDRPQGQAWAPGVRWASRSARHAGGEAAPGVACVCTFRLCFPAQGLEVPRPLPQGWD